jgi:hypothetical protein
LIDVQSVPQRQRFDGAWRGVQAAARRPVRLRQHQRYRVAGIQQCGQRAGREVWSAGEY